MQDDLLAYYALGAEPSRLDTGVGSLEYERTKEIVTRFLLPGSDVADVGGADGRYAAWLAAAPGPIWRGSTASKGRVRC